jgi:hypothetical protein
MSPRPTPSTQGPRPGSPKLTPILTPTDPNRGRLRPTRLDEAPSEIPLWQGILRYQQAPGYLIAGLEQNPAYGTAQTLNLQEKCAILLSDNRS